MKMLNLILLAFVILLGACIPSVNPFYSAKDVIFDPALAGEWREKDKPDSLEAWKFEKTDDGYKVTVVEQDGKQGTFDARLFKLKEERFLDIIPDDCNYAPNQAETVALCMFSGHLLFRVRQIEPELQLAGCDFDWLQKFLEKNPKALAHHREGGNGKEGGRIILTAETRDLQKFIMKHLAEGELFNKPGTLVRQRLATAPAAAAK